ncbi:MAG TPA: type 4a pilus biogenesis protein PilO [Candidatus Omnitrophota bacterium]|nr:type 4a pilus biogenesis protein PilO [Candidatus Omnitrophota bacterium]
MKQGFDLKFIIRMELLGMLVVLVLFTLFDFFPGIRKIYQYRQKMRLTSAARTQTSIGNERLKKTYQDKERAMSEGVDILKKEISAVQTKVSQEKNLPLISLEIEDLAGANNIEVLSIRPLEAEVQGKYELQRIEIRCKGDYKALAEFIRRLENNSAMMAIYEVTINKDPLIYPLLDVHLVPVYVFAYHDPDELLTTEIETIR